MPSRQELEELSMRLVALWRGERSQLELSHELGYSSNVVCHWEAGRRFPRAGVALRLFALARPEATQLFALRFAWDLPEQSRLDGPEGVSFVLRKLFKGIPEARIARELGPSRSTVHRWLSGASQPDLPGFLACFALASHLVHALDLFAEGEPSLLRGHAVPTEGTGPGEWQVLGALDLVGYRALDQHDSAWLAKVLVLEPPEVERALRILERYGLIRWDGRLWTRTRQEGLLSAGAPGPELRRAIRADAGRKIASSAPVRWFVLQANSSQVELQQVQDVLHRAQAEISRIVRRSSSKERLFQVSLATVMLDGQPSKPPDES